MTLQIQDLRRQLVTKKAFDEDESQREISRLKKEIQFLNAQVYNHKRQAYVKSSQSARKENMSGSQNQLSMAMAFQEKEKAMNNDAQSMRQRIEDLEAQAN